MLCIFNQHCFFSIGGKKSKQVKCYISLLETGHRSSEERQEQDGKTACHRYAPCENRATSQAKNWEIKTKRARENQTLHEYHNSNMLFFLRKAKKDDAIFS